MRLTGNIHSLKLDTLFFRLLVYFLIVIALFVFVYYLSLTFFKKQIHGEIISYNQLNVENTVRNYESQLYNIKNSAMSLYTDENVKNLYAMTRRGGQFDYYLASTISRQLSSNLLNSSYKYVETIFIVFPQTPVLIDTKGVYTSKEEIEKFLISTQSGVSYLSANYKHDKAFTILPSTEYKGYAVNQLGSKNMIPIVTNNQFYQNMNIVVMLDAEKMYNELHQSIHNDFLIMDSDNQVIFSAKPFKEIEKIQSLWKERFVVQNDSYYFNGQGDSGLLYVNMVPNKNIGAKMDRLNNIFLLILLIAILISIFISIVFSRQLNDPIKNMIDSLKQMKMPGKFSSRIKEFHVISDNLKDLYKKNSILRYYAYSNQLKDIHSNFDRVQELIDPDRPFHLIVFEITFKKAYNEKLNMDLNQATNGIREVINSYFSEQYPGSLTFQIERKQIVSILFIDGESLSIRDNLLELKQVFDMDHEYYYLTIAYSPLRKHLKELSHSYQESLAMISQRILNDDIQIINRHISRKTGNVLSANLEMEFHNYLMAGNEKDMKMWVRRQLDGLERKKNFAADYKQLARQVTAKADQALLNQQMDIGRMQVFGIQLTYCCTRSDYDLYFDYYLTTAAEIVRQHQDQRDPIATFVFEYLENNYQRDVSLETVADQLKITSGYLSTYFKEKTGWNFSEYLNHFRMEKAKHFLQHTNLKIKAVAEQVGYQNVNSFIRMFKKITGLTPGDFRKNEGQ